MRGGWIHAVLLAGLAWCLAAPAVQAATAVGGACSLNSECGPSPYVCIDPRFRPSGSEAWVGGYCSRPCGTGAACPSGSQCVAALDGAYCLKQCQPGQAGQCRTNYLCDSVSTGGNVCVPTCHAETDCAEGYTCRACDSRCVPKQNAGVRIGMACEADAECSTGETCLRVNGGTQGICSQPCGGGQCSSSCPEGSTCQKVGADEAPWCVRNCTEGTCNPVLQCAAFPEGVQACLPACLSAADCPGGVACTGGRCEGGGNPDGGSCALCGGPVDAGPGSPSGGGNPPIAGPGCGCQGAAVNAPGFLGALAVLFVAARRRRCQRP